jgi:hypothetical protein
VAVVTRVANFTVVGDVRDVRDIEDIEDTNQTFKTVFVFEAFKIRNKSTSTEGAKASCCYIIEPSTGTGRNAIFIYKIIFDIEAKQKERQGF